MSSVQDASIQPPVTAPGATNANTLSALEQRCTELEKTNQLLQQERETHLANIARLERERDDFRQATYYFLKRDCKPEDWDDFRVEDYTLPFEDVLRDLERLHAQ